MATVQRRDWPGAHQRAAFLALWLVLLAQCLWSVQDALRTHPSLRDVLYPAVFWPAALLLAVTRGRPPVCATTPRVLIGVAFLENVADRLGFLGPPGAPGVSWGDFGHFIAYTAKVNAFAPRGLIPALAVAATLAEGTLGLAMLAGFRVRLAAASSALLLFLFATAMVLSGLSQFEYAVYLMASAAWALSTLRRSAFSLDAVLARGAAAPQGPPSTSPRGPLPLEREG